MEFLKKNYEKVLLGVVLLGLTVGVALLPVLISAKRADLDEKRTSGRPNVKPLTNSDMTLEDSALQRVQSHVLLDFTTKHNLLNPVQWQKLPDGHLVKIQTGSETGAGALEVTDIKPLYLMLTFNAPTTTGYFVGVEKQAATEPGKRSKHETIAIKDTKNDNGFTLLEVKGPPEKPTELVLTLSDTGERASLGPDKPFQRVDGYSADLKYTLEAGKAWHAQRVGASLSFGGEQYKIVAISQTNVVVLAESNKKKTTITFNPAPEPR